MATGETDAHGVTLLTLNLWNLNEPVEQRMGRASAWVALHRPDLIALQEVSTLEGTTQAHVLAEAADHEDVHFDRSWQGTGRDQGLAIVSRWPLRPLAPITLPAVEGDETRILQRVDVDTDLGTIRLANTHLAWHPDHTAGRVLQAGEISRALRGCRNPVVLAGDLNDVHDSLPLRELAESGGLVDGCTEDEPTFAGDNPWTFQVSLFDRRVDHVLTSGGVSVLDTQVVMAGDDAPPASDHHGVLARVTT